MIKEETKRIMSWDSYTFSQSVRKCKKMNPTFPCEFSLWELGVLKCFEILEQGLGDQVLFKLILI
jgi:hypothetical protein